MADTKILQAILDRLSSLELMVKQGFNVVSERFDRVDKRIDKLGMQIANKRVKKLETHFISA